MNRSRWISLFLIFSLTSPSFGWGARGHRVATKIAEARLTPAAAKAVRELLLDGDTMVDVCNWADHEGHDAVPESSPWHYVNVPIDAAHYDAKYCGRGGNCVVAKIYTFRKTLADKKAPLVERRRALLFLIHLIEDIHQPLHVGDNHDRGGNNTQIQFLGAGTNMHRLWDSGVIEVDRTTDRAWVERVGKLLSPANIDAWSKEKSPEAWAEESLQAAKSAYLYPKGATQPIQTGASLGRDYVVHAEPIIERRLAMAGFRLANELNTLFP